LILWCCKLLP